MGGRRRDRHPPARPRRVRRGDLHHQGHPRRGGVPVDNAKVPWAIYCHPEVAFAGHSESAAKDAGFDVVVSKHRFAGNSRAQILGETDGLVKIIAEKQADGTGGQDPRRPHGRSVGHRAAVGRLPGRELGGDRRRGRRVHPAPPDRSPSSSASRCSRSPVVHCTDRDSPWLPARLLRDKYETSTLRGPRRSVEGLGGYQRARADRNNRTTHEGNPPMADIVMPQLGESVTEGTITRWFKAPRRRRHRGRAALRGVHRQGRHRGPGHLQSACSARSGCPRARRSTWEPCSP